MKPEAHRLRDRLLPLAAGVSMDDSCTEIVKGKACGAKLEVLEGFTKKVDGYQTQRVDMRRVAHAAIDPRLGRTRSGQLYSMQSLEPGQGLQGIVWAKDAALGMELEELLAGQGDES